MPSLSLLSRLWQPRKATVNWPQHTVQRWLILQQGDNPSTDYYVWPRLHASGLPVSCRHLDLDKPRAQDFANGTGVVIVRYLNGQWAKALRAYRGRLAQVVYFMDDNLLQPEQWIGLPKPYMKKLNKYCRPFIGDIQQLASSYWFSTHALHKLYRFGSAQVVVPQPLPDDAAVASSYTAPPGPIRLFYHGTAAHTAEINWLQPIIAEVLKHCPDAHFEIMGNHDVNVQYRALPRTRILHPMSWPNYLSHCRALQGHIGLAPLLSTRFNAGRSHSKIYDIARCGAVGLYSTGGPYQPFISHAQNGMLLANEPQIWVDTLCRLIDDRAELNKLRQAAGELLRAPTSP